MALTLATVETAIEGVMSSGQSVTVDGMSYTKASLPALMEMRRVLRAEASRANRPTMRAFNIRHATYGNGNSEADPTPVNSI